LKADEWVFFLQDLTMTFGFLFFEIKSFESSKTEIMLASPILEYSIEEIKTVGFD